MSIGTMTAIVFAALAIALAFRLAAGCYRRHRAELHDVLQGLCEFHVFGDPK